VSESLRADLESFADRWEAAIAAEVYDDRYDGVPIMQSLVGGWYALKRIAHPADARKRRTEDARMREVGEKLRSRLQRELGPRYRVTYHH
jgi:hypothetical protein